MTTATAQVVDPKHDESSGGRLVVTDGRALPLTEVRLSADARGGVARVVLTQRFENPYADALAVTYLLPLPADAAVVGFAFQIGARRVVGEVDRREAARERYQQALLDGRSASLVEQDRSSLFTQEIGNIPPHTAVVAEITLDQRLVWLPEGAWEWRFPTTVAPRFQGTPGRVADAGKLQVPIAAGAIGARLFLGLTVRDVLGAGGLSPESPSHPVKFSAEAGLLAACLIAEAGAPLDRDLVVRWPVAQPAVGLGLQTCRPAAGRAHAESAYGLLTVVPPRPESRGRAVPRDLIVLLDTSGSMGGEPLAQARRVVGALIDSLTDADRLELIEFSSAARRWNRKAVEATAKNKKRALAWLAALEAGGSTEMREGIFEALRPLRGDAQRQVVLVTDGLIGFESEVVAAILAKLPEGSRLHTVGVGSSVNRSLTGPAARAGNGVEVVIGLGEDPERAAKRLAARTTAPLVTELVVEGSALLETAPARLPDLFAGCPSLVGLRLRATGGTLLVRGRTAQGAFRDRVEVPAVDFGAGNGAAAALFAREQVEDLETRLASGAPRAELDAQIERVGIDFQIATRRTSWVAVSDEQTVDPRRPTRHEEMPHELPFGMSAEGLGLRAGSAAHAGTFFAGLPQTTTPAGVSLLVGERSPGAPPPPARRMAAPAPPAASTGMLDRLFQKKDVAGADKAKAKTEAPRFRSREVSEDDELATPSPAEQERSVDAPALEERAELRSESVSAPATKALSGGAVAGPQGALALPGRVVLARGQELVLEVRVDARGLPWAPVGPVHLVLEDGSVVMAELDLSRTTAPVTLAAGQVARLVLRLPSGAGAAAARATLVCHGVSLVVELGPGSGW